MNSFLKRTCGALMLGALFLAPGRLDAGSTYSLNLTAATSGYVDVTTSPSLTPTPLTFEAWVYARSVKSSTIISRGNGGNGLTDYIFQLNPDSPNENVAFFGVGSGAWNYSAYAFPLSTWTHVAVTFDGTTELFYINGVPAGTNSQPGSLYLSGSDMYIGRQGLTCDCNFFDGYLSELRIWNTVRSAGQIKANMNFILNGTQPGLVAYYHLNEGTGSTANDSSGNSHTGTLYNSASWVASVPPLTNGTYTLAASTLWEGPTAGSDSIVLSASNIWEAVANAPWLHLSAATQSGTGSTNVIFSFDANTGLTRTGTLSVASQTLTIVQAGLGYAVANSPMTLVSGLYYPPFVSLDGAGNVYITDTHSNAVRKWNATNYLVTTVVNSGFSNLSAAIPSAAGNIYITDNGNGTFKEWIATNNTLVTLATNVTFGSLAMDSTGNLYYGSTNSQIDKWTVASNLLSVVPISFAPGTPEGLAVDASGNLYNAFIGISTSSVRERIAATGQTISGLLAVPNFPNNLAVDVSGNIYVTDFYSGTSGSIVEWSPAAGGVVSDYYNPEPFSAPWGAAVDGYRNFYYCDQTSVREILDAYVNTNAVTVYSTAGTNVLPVVLPAAQNLAGPFAPTTDQPWLSIVGATNGIVSFATTPNTGTPPTNRLGHVIVLGQAVPITQGMDVITLSTNALFEGAAAGTDSVLLTVPAATSAWTASTIYPWLHLSTTNKSGTGNQWIVFTFDSNLGYARTGSITIAGLTLTVSQATPFVLGTNLLNEPYTGGTDSVLLTNVPPGTNWTASANVPWLHLAPAYQSGSGSTNLVFTFDANSGGPRSGTITIAALTLTVNQATTYTLAPASVVEPPGAGSDSLLLSGVPATNSWTASTTNSWLHLNSGSQSGTGGTNIMFTFDANTGSTRSGIITVAGLLFTVTQDASTYSLNTYLHNEPATNGTDSVSLAGVPANESWTATANASWLHVNPTNQTGTGSQSIWFSYDANQGLARTGTVTIAAMTLTVVQATSYTLTPTSFQEPMNAGGDNFLLAGVPATNTWTASTAASWLHIAPASQSGMGNATISFTYDLNSGLPRAGTITVGGLSLVVTQFGAPLLGTYTRLEGPVAGTDSVMLGGLYPTNTWTATTNAAWLHIASTNQSGVGNEMIVFTFDSNSGSTRTGTLTVDGMTLTVSQAGAPYTRVTTPIGIYWSGPYDNPPGLAADAAGNLFFADNYYTGEWSPTDNVATLLITNGCAAYGNGPLVADRADNIYFEDQCNELVEWSVAQGTGTVLFSGLNPYYENGHITRDSAGNLYFVYNYPVGIVKWTQATGSLAALAVQNAPYMQSIAVDAVGNIYLYDSGYNQIEELPAGGGSQTTLASGFAYSESLATDGGGNLYLAQGVLASSPGCPVTEWNMATGGQISWTFPDGNINENPDISVDDIGDICLLDNGQVSELLNAYVNTNGISEPGGAGSDSLPVVVPATTDLNGPFQPSSDSSWLTVTGATNGVVSFSFQANTNQTRVGNIYVLGLTVSITQSAAVVTPPVLNINPVPIGGGFQVSFTNNQGVTNFTILTSSNLYLPLANWTVVGPPSNSAPNQFQFIIPVTPGTPQSYYNVRSP